MMSGEDSKIHFDDQRHRDYQTLSPSKRPSIVATLDHDETGDVVDAVEVKVDAGVAKKKRFPRRVLHFSDGILEEYSTDEEEEELKRQKLREEEEEKRKQALIDPKTLSWIPWMVHYTWFAGSSVLSYCESWGESLAWFLGITSPKYYYELEEYKRMKEIEEMEQKKMETEMHGWTEPTSDQDVVGTDPTKSHETS